MSLVGCRNTAGTWASFSPGNTISKSRRSNSRPKNFTSDSRIIMNEENETFQRQEQWHYNECMTNLYRTRTHSPTGPPLHLCRAYMPTACIFRTVSTLHMNTRTSCSILGNARLFRFLLSPLCVFGSCLVWSWFWWPCYGEQLLRRTLLFLCLLLPKLLASVGFLLDCPWVFRRFSFYALLLS